MHSPKVGGQAYLEELEKINFVKKVCPKRTFVHVLPEVKRKVEVALGGLKDDYKVAVTEDPYEVLY